MDSTWLTTAIFVPLIAFAIYRRFRRTFGKQPISSWRMMMRMGFLSLVAVAFIATQPTPLGFLAGGLGAALGVGLGLFGLKHTRYEATAEGRFYTPNGWIGLVVTALFLGRMAARMVTLYQAGAFAAQTTPMDGFQRSPLTLGLFFLLAGYYVSFLAGVLLASRRLTATTA